MDRTWLDLVRKKVFCGGGVCRGGLGGGCWVLDLGGFWGWCGVVCEGDDCVVCGLYGGFGGVLMVIDGVGWGWGWMGCGVRLGCRWIYMGLGGIWGPRVYGVRNNMWV